MFRTKIKPFTINYDYIIKIAFTHPDNAHAPIRQLARMLGMRPGTVYRSLKRQGLVKPYSKRETETPISPETESPITPESFAKCKKRPNRECFPDTREIARTTDEIRDHRCYAETKKIKKNYPETETPQTPPADRKKRYHHPLIQHLTDLNELAREIRDSIKDDS